MLSIVMWRAASCCRRPLPRDDGTAWSRAHGTGTMCCCWHAGGDACVLMPHAAVSKHRVEGQPSSAWLYHVCVRAVLHRQAQRRAGQKLSCVHSKPIHHLLWLNPVATALQMGCSITGSSAASITAPKDAPQEPDRFKGQQGAQKAFKAGVIGPLDGNLPVAAEAHAALLAAPRGCGLQKHAHKRSGTPQQGAVPLQRPDASRAQKGAHDMHVARPTGHLWAQRAVLDPGAAAKRPPPPAQAEKEGRQPCRRAVVASKGLAYTQQGKTARLATSSGRADRV